MKPAIIQKILGSECSPALPGTATPATHKGSKTTLTTCDNIVSLLMRMHATNTKEALYKHY